MRKLIVNNFSTLDGVMQAPGGPEEDPTGDFKFGGWIFHYWDDLMGKVMGEIMDKPFDLLLGRRTYEIFAAHWPYSKEEPIASQLNNAKKYVATKTLDKADWNNSTLIKGDAAAEIKKLKEQEGPELQVHGSSNLLQTLISHNLIDQYNVWIFPVVVGKGKRLFGSGTKPSSLKLIDSKISSSGVIITMYQPGGEINVGSFQLEKPSEAELARRKKISEESSDNSIII